MYINYIIKVNSIFLNIIIVYDNTKYSKTIVVFFPCIII